MHTNKTFAEKLLAQKTPWTPGSFSSENVMEGAEIALGRALALRKLEIPVGGFITDCLAKHKDIFTPDVVTLLESNVLDEEKHDQGLNNLTAALGIVTPEAQSQADELVKRWEALAEKVGTLVVAGRLELSVFFVILPMLRFLGGKSARGLSASISSDEQVHVAINLHLADKLGYNTTSEVDRLRAETLEWIVEPLDAPEAGKWGIPSTWLKSSKSLYSQGKAPELAATKNSVYTAFFEVNNKSLDLYY